VSARMGPTDVSFIAIELIIIIGENITRRIMEAVISTALFVSL